MSAWKPGDVGITGNKYGNEIPTRFMVVESRDGTCHFRYADGDATVHPPRDDARLLLVIDPEDREQVERLCVASWNADPANGAWSDQNENTRRSFRHDTTAGLRSLLAPPKPDEPTDFACRVVTDGVQHWARILTPDGPRWVTDGGVGVTWDELVRDHPDVEVQR